MTVCDEFRTDDGVWHGARFLERNKKTLQSKKLPTFIFLANTFFKNQISVLNNKHCELAVVLFTRMCSRCL